MDITENNQTKKHGGYRPSNPGGRPKKDNSPEAQQARIEIVEREFIFPALCQAFKSDPGQFKDRYLTVELSKVDIKRAYGQEGLSIWLRFFKQVKIGGCTKTGKAYNTRWSLHLGTYGIAKLLVESLGHTMKDLPDPGFPPVAMQARLKALDAKKVARETRKLEDAVNKVSE